MKKMNFCNTFLIFIPEVFIRCKKSIGARGDKDREFLIPEFVVVLKYLVCSQLLTVLVYGGSPVKSHEQS